uniref:methylesterase 10-like n=1 Tax=Erigeron canadensis TaxID=72917 RepID=UPI001CB89208|nr:methylesterase 10-like [Erigeron canadensis]
MPTTTSSTYSSNKHFVLVHGLGHGAWCWYKVVSHLRSAGHQVTAVDLGASGVHPSRLEDIPSFYEYIQPLVQILESISVDQRVVLVGHSYGGLPISLAMEKFSNIVSAAVFISAYMPNCKDPPSVQMQQYFMNSKPETFMDCRFTLDNGMPKTAELGEGYMTTMMYPNCLPEDLTLAKMLVRPSGLFFEDMSKDSLLTKDKYGSISRIYVVCQGDQVMNEEFQKFVVKDSPPNEVKHFPGAGHMIMLSKSEDLSLYLQEIASKYP